MIKLVHLKAAMAVWEYNVRSVEQLFGDKAANETEDRVYRLLEGGPMNQTQFHDHMNIDRYELGDALDQLERAGRIRQTTIKRKGPGRPARQWALVNGHPR